MVDRQTIDAKILSRMFLAGAKNLEAKKEWINELNVFPVPDGDTGTNMTMTIMSAASEVSSLTDPDMETLAKAISSGSLRGARGNSGVILSQLLRGFTKGTKGHKEMDAVVIAAAMEKAVETAYKAVMKPKEGTILTVAKGMAVRAVELSEEETTDLLAFCEEVIKEGDHVLSMTPRRHFLRGRHDRHRHVGTGISIWNREYIQFVDPLFLCFQVFRSGQKRFCESLGIYRSDLHLKNPP